MGMEGRKREMRGDDIGMREKEKGAEMEGERSRREGRRSSKRKEWKWSERIEKLEEMT